MASFLLAVALAFVPEPFEVTPPASETHAMSTTEGFPSDMPMPVANLDMNAYMGRWYQVRQRHSARAPLELGQAQLEVSGGSPCHASCSFPSPYLPT